MPRTGISLSLVISAGRRGVPTLQQRDAVFSGAAAAGMFHLARPGRPSTPPAPSGPGDHLYFHLTTLVRLTPPFALGSPSSALNQKRG
jgi:hypothetical protein